MQFKIVYQCLLCQKLYVSYSGESKRDLSFEFQMSLRTTPRQQHTCVGDPNNPTVAGVALFAGVMTEEEWIRSQEILEKHQNEGTVFP